ncbi:hypothetical protein A2U01_0005219 [Trifolium medium]|uniref:Uncharacterized protein n=1 Tax=Trifolium medium TaxID=97028 RepID=A0A392MA44_9FABA|nr:hypothetical protein [Trifolium medium]
MLFPDRVNSVDGESAAVIVESSDSASKESLSRGSVSSDMYPNFDLVWDNLEDLLSTVEKADFNRESPDSNMMKALIIKNINFIFLCINSVMFPLKKKNEADEELALFDELKLAQRSIRTFKLIKPRENVNLFIRDCN